MDGEKQEFWWFDDYPIYSLKRYKEMPIYQRFKSSTRPFNKIIGDYREAFWRDDNCYIFEWFDSKELRGEKFGLDHNSITYFYEHWFTDDEMIHTVEKSWLCDPTEWGLIIKYYPDYEEHVTWSSESEKKVCEKITKIGDQLKSKTVGQVVTPEGLQDFTELFWKNPNGYGKERVWTCGDSKGEEKEYQEGDKKWGTSEVEVDDEVTKKVWTEEGNHKWGESTGEEGYEKWHEKWEKTSEGSYEELIVEDRFQNRGKLRVRSQSNNYHVEWEGTKPKIIIPEAGKPEFENRDAPKSEIPAALPPSKTKMMKKPEGKKLRSGRPGKPKEDDQRGKEDDLRPKEDDLKPREIDSRPRGAGPRSRVLFEEPESLVEPAYPVEASMPYRAEVGKSMEFDKLAAQLSTLFKELKKDLTNHINELKSTEPYKTIPNNHQFLLEELKNIRDPSPLDPQDSLLAIKTLRDLEKRVLSSEKALLAEVPSSDQLKSLFDQSSTAVLSLGSTLDPSKTSATRADLQKLSKEFQSTSSPKEKLRIIQELTLKLQDLEKESEKKTKELEDQLSRVSFELNRVLKTIKDVTGIPESSENLEYELTEMVKKQAAQISALFKDLKKDLTNHVTELRSTEPYKTIANNHLRLQEELKAMKDPNPLNVQDSLSAIQALRDLEKRVLNSEKALLSELSTSDQMKSLFDQSSSAVLSLVPSLDLNKITETRSDLQRLTKDFENASNPKERLKIISELTPKLLELHRESENHAEELEKELARVKFELNRVLKLVKDTTGTDEGGENFEDALNQMKKKQAVQLSSVFKDLKKDLRNHINELKTTEHYLTVPNGHLVLLQELELVNDPNPFDPLESLSAIQTLRNIEKRALNSEKALLDELPTSDQLKSLFEHSFALALSFIPSLPATLVAGTQGDLQKLKKDFEATSSPKEKLGLIEELTSRLNDLQSTSEKTTEDFEKELNRVKFELNRVLKAVKNVTGVDGSLENLQEGLNEMMKKQAVQISTLFKDLKNDLESHMTELKSTEPYKTIPNNHQSLLEELKKIRDPDPFNPQDSLSAINTLRNLEKQVLSSEKALLAELPSSDQLKSLFEKSSTGILSLGPTLDPKNMSGTQADLQKLTKDFEKSSSPKEKLRIISELVPKLQDLRKASEKNTEDLEEELARVSFELNRLLKIVKDTTGLDESSENLEDLLSEMKQKQSQKLPFEAEELLSHLTGRAVKDLKKMKFLAGLVGNEDEIEETTRLEEMAESYLPEPVTGSSEKETLVQIDQFFQSFKEIGSQVEGKINEFIQKLVERLVNPEPLEKDVANLITGIEYQAKVAEKLAKADDFEKFEALERRKEGLPGAAQDLVPYLCELCKDFGAFVISLLDDSLKMTRPEEQKLNFAISKKMRAAPVLALREVEHLFSGPDTEDMVSMIIKLNRVANYFMKLHPIGDPALYSMCQKDFSRLASLSPVEVKALGRDYSEVLVSFIESEDSSEFAEEELSIRSKRTSLRGRPVLDWESIYQSKGLDLDSGLLTEIINQEQELASVYILNLSSALGSSEHKRLAVSLVDQSKEIRSDLDVKTKIENFFHLRLEESKLVSKLSLKLDSLSESIQELDLEKETSLAKILAEVRILAGQNPNLKQQVLTLAEKEQQCRASVPENSQQLVSRVVDRMELEKELLRIKEASNPGDSENDEMVKTLTGVETGLYSGLKAFNGFLQLLSTELLPGTKSLKHLTEHQVSTTVPGLLASINTGLQSLNVLVQAVVSVLESSPMRSTLSGLVRVVQTEMQKDDSETEPVFANLFKLCGSSDDKLASKKLRESRSALPEEKTILKEQVSNLLETLSKVLPARSAQSKLQNKLIRETLKLRDDIDEIDVNDEDLVSKALREANNSTLPEDTKSKEMLEKIKKNLENISEKSPSNIPECIQRITSRLKEAEKIERLRKELREKASKEIFRLKNEIQDKETEISAFQAKPVQKQADVQEILRKQSELKAENDELKSRLKSLENLSKTAEELLIENQKIKQKLSLFEQKTESRESKDQPKKPAEDLASKDSQIRDLLQEVERLTKDLEGHFKKFKRSLTRNILHRLSCAFRGKSRQALVKLRNFRQPAEVPTIELLPVLKNSPEESKDEASSMAEEILAKTAAELFAQNKIIQQFKEAGSPHEKPLSIVNVFKFLEELMDNKFESDKQQVSEGKPLISMPEFMMEFLLKTYGIQSLALKFLSQFIGGFYEIYKENNKYAAFFARILQIFHPEPAPLNLAVFIVKARIDFHPLIETRGWSLSENDRNKDRSLESPENGGKAFFVDTLELVYSLFQEDPTGGEVVLEMIRPEKVSIDDFVVYMICHKIAKLGKTSENIFNLINKNHSGSVNFEEFSNALRSELDLWISDKNLKKLMESLSKNKQVSKEAFVTRANLKVLQDWNKNNTWTVTKCDFLSSLLDVFSQKQRKVLKILHEKAKPSGVFNKQLFINVVTDLDPSLDSQTIDKMFDEAKDKGPEVHLQAASEVASKYSLGDLRGFKTKELLQELQRRKIVNTTEDESVSVSTNSRKISFIEGNIRIDRDEEEKTIIRKKLIKKLVKRIVG